MPVHLQYIVVAASVSCGVISGLLFSFSIVVMRALLELPAPAGMFAMQRINRLIINPLFLVLFLGSSALCLIVAVIAARGMPSTGAFLLLTGATAYLFGPLAITMGRNVPLNNRLAKVAPHEAEMEWPRYVSAWLRWNHVRAALGAAGTALLALGLAYGATGQ